MPVKSMKSWAALAVGAALSMPAAAELTAADLAKLGTTLTPDRRREGGQRGGNDPRVGRRNHASRSPAYKEGGHYPDPYASDKALFTIDGKNVDKYKDNLSVGQVAMIKKYPDYKMIVYPTHRSAAFPACHYEETKQCAAKAQLAAGGNGVVGCSGRHPLPDPEERQRGDLEHGAALRGRHLRAPTGTRPRSRAPATTRW